LQPEKSLFISKGRNDMTVNSDPSIFMDNEQEALWYLGGQRIINALGERIGGAFRLTEFVTPAGTFVARMHKKEDEALYVIEGEATIACGGQVFPVSTGTFLFLPCDVPYYMEVSTSSSFRYLTWMTPAGFAHDVTKMGNPNTALLLAPPLAPDQAKVQRLADLFIESTTLTFLEDLHRSSR
jgi:mannose-6-phosphate isomerase-like protein (cupin superfamily)